MHVKWYSLLDRAVDNPQNVQNGLARVTPTSFRNFRLPPSDREQAAETVRTADMVLLVRAHTFTHVMLERVARWAPDCAAAGIAVVLSLDTSVSVPVNKERDRAAAFFRQRKVSSLIRLHTYNEEDLFLNIVPVVQAGCRWSSRFARRASPVRFSHGGHHTVAF